MGCKISSWLSFISILVFVGLAGVVVYFNFREDVGVGNGGDVEVVGQVGMRMEGEDEGVFTYVIKRPEEGRVSFELPLPEGFELEEGSVELGGGDNFEVRGEGRVEFEVDEGEEGYEVVVYRARKKEGVEVDLKGWGVGEEGGEEGVVVGNGEVVVSEVVPGKLFWEVGGYIKVVGKGLGRVDEMIFMEEGEEVYVLKRRDWREEDGEIGFVLEGESDLREGVYDVKFRGGGEEWESSESFSVVKGGVPLILEVSPRRIEHNKPSTLVLQGVGLSEVDFVQLSNEGLITETGFEYISDRVLVLKLNEKLPVGEYEVRLVSKSGFYEREDIKIWVVEGE